MIATLWLWCCLILTMARLGTPGNAGAVPARYPAHFSPQHRITDSLGYQPHPRILESSPAVRLRRVDYVAHPEGQEDAYPLEMKGSLQDFLVESVAGEDDLLMRGGAGGTESMSVVKSVADVDKDEGYPFGNISKSVMLAASSLAVHHTPLDSHYRMLPLIIGGLSALATFL